MRIFDCVDDDMVTAYMDVLPVYCPFCSGSCWKIDDYPYACRCSNCSSYFHRQFLTCADLVYIGYDPYLCTDCHYSNALRIFEIVDGRLVEVCKGCAKWLCEEGYVEDLEVWDGDFDSYIDIAFDNLDG